MDTKKGNDLRRWFPNEENDKYRLKLLVVCTAKVRTNLQLCNFFKQQLLYFYNFYTLAHKNTKKQVFFYISNYQIYSLTQIN